MYKNLKSILAVGAVMIAFAGVYGYLMSNTGTSTIADIQSSNDLAAAAGPALQQGGYIRPTITSITPTSGPLGTTITIHGQNFSPTNNTVMILPNVADMQYQVNVLQSIPSSANGTVIGPISIPSTEIVDKFLGIQVQTPTVDQSVDTVSNMVMYFVEPVITSASYNSAKNVLTIKGAPYGFEKNLSLYYGSGTPVSYQLLSQINNDGFGHTSIDVRVPKQLNLVNGTPLYLKNPITGYISNIYILGSTTTPPTTQSASVNITATPGTTVSSGGTITFGISISTSTTPVVAWKIGVDCTGGATAKWNGGTICGNITKIPVANTSTALSLPVVMTNPSSIARSMTLTATAVDSNGNVIATKSLKTIVTTQTISPISITSPSAGQKLTIGSTQKISWTGGQNSNGTYNGVDISLIPQYCNNGSCIPTTEVYHTIAFDALAATLLNWTVGLAQSPNYPNGYIVPAGNYYIKVCSSGTTVCNISGVVTLVSGTSSNSR